MHVKLGHTTSVVFPYLLSGPSTIEVEVTIGTPTKIRLEPLDDRGGEFQLELAFQVNAPAEIEAVVKGAWPYWTLPRESNCVGLQEFIDAQRDEAGRRRQIVMNAFRWRYRAYSNLDYPIPVALSSDGIKWHNTTPTWWRWTEDDRRVEYSQRAMQEGLADAIAYGAAIPVSRELYNEASAMFWLSPRSALVMLAAAAEVGFKEYVDKVAPDAGWLVREIQTPPLEKMIEKYLPTLTPKETLGGEFLRPPKAMVDAIGKLARKRNRIVHGGEKAATEDEFVVWKCAVSQFLYIVELYSGHKWAEECITPETRGRMREIEFDDET